MTDFHEILFPPDISYGSQGGPKFRTSVFAADSGFEARTSGWRETRAEYDVSQAIQTQFQMDVLTAFFYARRGRAYGFRFKDWNDYAGENLLLGEGDFVSTVFQAKKTYISAGPDGVQHTYVRELKKLAWDSQVGMKVDDAFISQNTNDAQHYTIDYNTGAVTLAQPMRGRLYAGNTPQVNLDFISPAEGGHATSYSNAGGAPIYDFAAGRALLFGTFNYGGIGGDSGVRVIDIATGAETLQKSAAQCGITQTNADSGEISGLIACDGAGALFVQVGSEAGKAIFKLDAALSAVTHWGTAKSTVDAGSSPAVGKPGCCSLDGARFLLIPASGAIAVHSTTTCERLSTVMSSGAYAGGCPYKSNGFAIVSTHTADSAPLRLTIQPGAEIPFVAMQWGAAGATALWAVWDNATGGLLLAWVDASGTFWCGLYHDADGGFRWQRKMPRMLGFSGSLPNPQAVLQGTMVWAMSSTYEAGANVWFLDTATGALSTRKLADSTFGPGQVFDPGRKKLFTLTDNGNARVYSVDLTAVSLAPAAQLTVQYVEFHVPVRFDTDHLNPKHEFWNTQSWEQIPLIEVRNWNDVELD